MNLNLEDLTAELARRAARARCNQTLHEADPARLQYFRGQYVSLSDFATEVLEVRAIDWRERVETEIEKLPS